MGIIGAILGDIAGSRWEFAFSTTDRVLNNYELFTDKNFFTDDTVLSIACKDAIDHKGILGPNFTKYYDIYGHKYPMAGYGASFINWLGTEKKTPYNSFGNGSAMRCSYVGEYAKSLRQCERLAAQSAKCTHDHPQGIKGAVVLAKCVFMAKKGISKDEILKYAIAEYPAVNRDEYGLIYHAMKNGKYMYGPEIPTSEYKNKIGYEISCQGSVPVAIRCFYETKAFEECMYLINSMDIDTDTVGAIAGAICHSFYGCCYSEAKDKELLKRYLTEDLYSKLKV